MQSPATTSATALHAQPRGKWLESSAAIYCRRQRMYLARIQRNHLLRADYSTIGFSNVVWRVVGA